APRRGPGPASSRGSSSSCPPSAGCGWWSFGVLLEDGDARQVLALDELEARAAAGGDVREEGFVEREAAARRGRVAAADDRVAGGLREGLRDGDRALGEVLELEHAHGPVPEHGRGVGDLLAEQLRRLRADVHTLL